MENFWGKLLATGFVVTVIGFSIFGISQGPEDEGIETSEIGESLGVFLILWGIVTAFISVLGWIWS